MKLVSFVIILSILCSLFSFHCSALAMELDDSIILNKSDSSFDYSFHAEYTPNYHIEEIVEENNIVIYGNYTDFDSSLLYSLTHSKDKICIFYDLDLTDNLSNSHEIMCNNAVIYYYKDDVPHIHSYISNSAEAQELIEDINSYVNEVLLEINDESDRSDISTAFSQYSMYTSGDESFITIHRGSFRKEEKPYGYIDCDYVVQKCVSSDVKNLYITQATFSFTPGKMAKDSGNTGYGNWYNSTGYVKVKASAAEGEVGTDQVLNGGTAVFKDAYPITSPQNPPITSSSYRPYQLPTYLLSAQKDSKDTEKYTWLYTCTYPQSDAYRLNVGYMFEMNNSGHDLLEGDVALRFEYQMTVYKKNIWGNFKQSHTFSGSTFRNHD